MLESLSSLSLDNPSLQLLRDTSDVALRRKLHTVQSLQSSLTDPDALLDEVQAGAFLGLTPRALQAMRQRGGGPLFVRISSRCIRYRRRDLIAWTESRLARSTSDTSCEK